MAKDHVVALVTGIVIR